MLAVAQNGSANNPATGAYIVQGGTQTTFLWCATGRDNTTTNSSGAFPGTTFIDACRSATTCYMRGLSEKIEIQTNSGVPWQWRRICFTVKGLSSQLGFSGIYENSNGFGRYLYNVAAGGSTDAPTLTGLYSILFKGVANIDFNDVRNAAVDTTRVTVKSDTTTIISSGNANGQLKLYNRWYPMNKNLVYDDDEYGDSKAARAYSVTSKAGMGDYWIADFISTGYGATTSDLLSFNPSSTLYWHEK